MGKKDLITSNVTGLKRERETPKKDRKKKKVKKEVVEEDVDETEENEEVERPPKEEKKVPRTLDNTREFDETVVAPDDLEVIEDEKVDPFADFFEGNRDPKVLVTTTLNPSRRLRKFAIELMKVIGRDNSEFRSRVGSVKKMIDACNERDFTDIVILSEWKKQPQKYSMTVIHLPNGPTAQFKLSSVHLPKEIEGHGTLTSHKPELILNNFTTRLGHTIGRMLASVFPHDPNFVGRRVVTFHNQRDFIFFRHHRYVFDDGQTARLQELGPRFTMKLKKLQHGAFEKNGECEWLLKKEIETSRRRFFL